MERISRPKLKNSSVKAGDVCSIIKTCGEAKVRVLKYRDLHVVFALDGELEQLDAVKLAPLASADTAISDHELKSQTNRTLELEAILTKEERLAMMAIEDPAEYERQVMAGELEDESEFGRQEADDRGTE